MAIDIGTRITWADREFVIRDLIKSGGFGNAFRAEQTKPSPDTVVVKVPAAHVLAHPVWLQKFEREARILANIRHPNVVKIIAFWEFKSGDKALVQELVLGANHLDAYVAAHPGSTASLMLQTLYALRAFHDQTTPSAVHRDLSPRNVLVSDDGVVKVIDFGLAKEDPRATQILTITGEAFGTPGCMAPEQVHDAATVDHRADLYALGRSFASALQGVNPQFARPERLAEPWKTICTKLTEDDPNDRPPSAAETITDAMTRFAAAGIVIENFELHVEEMHEYPADVGWSALCQSHFFGLNDYTQGDIELLAKLTQHAFAPPFDANTFFDLLEQSAALSAFSSGFVGFGDADSLGRLYANLYPNLDVPWKLRCFERLCKTAIRLHRYSVMGKVRAVYGGETDPNVRAQLVRILDTEDPPPTPTIEGRGVLPRSP